MERRELSPFLASIVFLSAVSALGGPPAAPVRKAEALPPTSTPVSSEPYCGLYCVFAVMRLYDRDVDFASLLSPEYISSTRGSTLEELQRAAVDRGLYVTPIGNLTTRALRSSPYPLILHVKTAGRAREYGHYELFLGTRDGKARLYDPPSPVRTVPFAELARRWQGTALVLSDAPIDMRVITGPAMWRLVAHALAAAALIGMLKLVQKRRRASSAAVAVGGAFKVSAVQGLGLVLAALSLGATYHYMDEEGFLASPGATEQIQKDYAGTFIPRIDVGDAQEYLDGDTLFIDARFPRDFESGHFAGAINVPVNTNREKRRDILAAVSKDAPLLVYCQSARCTYAERLAIGLVEDGYSRVAVMRGGWQEYQRGQP